MKKPLTNLSLTYSGFSKAKEFCRNDTQRIIALVGNQIYSGYFLFSEYFKDPDLNPKELEYIQKVGFKNPSKACVRYWLIKYFKAKDKYWKPKKRPLKAIKEYLQKYEGKLNKHLSLYWQEQNKAILLNNANPEHQIRVFRECVARGYVPKSTISFETQKYYLRLNLTHHIYYPKPFDSQQEALDSGFGISGFTGSEIVNSKYERIYKKRVDKPAWKDLT